MLTLRELNRATLARQHLLRRHQGGVTSVVHRLAGLQAQEPRPPYIGMWTRLDGFARDDLHAALRARTLVRATMMRATLHLVTAADFAEFRPLLRPLLAGAARRFPEIDFDAVAAVAERLLAEGPHTFNELRPRLENAFPGAYDRALGYAVRMIVPLIMVPTDDTWSFPRESAFALPGIELAAEPDLATFVERYLAAFGPASAADMQTWSGLTGLKSVLNGMRDRLEVMVDEHGKELFDLPEAPRPEGDMPAPVRFLPDFDNLMLGHADRTRVLPEEYRGAVVTKNLRVRATYLVDGFVAGTWQIKRTGRKAKLLITPFTPVSPEVLEEEGMALLAFAEPDAEARSLEVMG